MHTRAPIPSTSRRRWLQAVSALGAVSALSACGFKLRQAPQFAFSTIHLGTAAGSLIGQGLKRQLEGSGQVRVVPIAEAQVLLEVLAERRERTVVGLNANGEVREVTIRSRFRFRVRSHDDQELVPETELLREMDVSYAESQALAKDAEVEMLFKSMASDAVDQIMRRLAMIKRVTPLPGAAAAAAPTSGASQSVAPAAPAASGSGW
ncbi:hypothetical protein CCO03_02065 [Comamonas serinivorans]|uniref:LPS-assembly lipoprotein LptE n=1 Tax=Comamonas serinivorans TaxID=1082851 RepID=A0A1Y0EK22_9BURK|nr:LPS assembly lipoprotein LptE [Comamonas serinivorans]ARU03632.1 hypothetical protein CCO03_02065 [Comamonas serinivorans]